jgi:hypothetical protein
MVVKNWRQWAWRGTLAEQADGGGIEVLSGVAGIAPQQGLELQRVELRDGFQSRRRQPAEPLARAQPVNMGALPANPGT